MAGEWSGPEGAVGRVVSELSRETLNAYREAPRLVEEHANLERSAVEGGYGRRQLYELVQNGADELLNRPGRVEVVLTEGALYCANEGAPLTEEGAGALLFAHLSPKRGVEIGRFGLGFKSVLGISRRPEIFSRSGSLRFDPDVARELIGGAIRGSPVRTPTLRIASSVDPQAEAETDFVLADLMAWATTVVRLGRDSEDSSWLERDIRDFPAEFLLFSQHVRELSLGDSASDYSRLITARSDDGDVLLREGDRESRWRVFSSRHRPSQAAKRDAGAMAEREEIPLAWAVERRRGRVGSFWAFFPTLDRTTLSGVVNAPWKLNEDRTRVLEGPFNEELIRAVSELVTENLPELVSEDDPGIVLDLLPARGRELRGWADGVMTDAVNTRAAYVPSIPDQASELELPSRLTLHPPEVPRELLDLWAQSPGRPVSWAHPSIENPDRRATAVLYLGPVGGRVASVTEWLEALISRDDPVARSAAAIVIASALLRAVPAYEREIRAAAIVLDESGDFVVPHAGELYVRAPLPVDAEARYVHEDLVGDDTVRHALEALGIRKVDAFRLLESHVARHSKDWRASEWDLLWLLAREAGQPQRISELFEGRELDARNLSVRTRAGNYKRLISLLLPGDILPELSSEDNDAAVDTAFHRQELPLLKLLGASSSVLAAGGRTDEPWYSTYRKEAMDSYLEDLEGSGAAPNREYLGFRERRFPGPSTALQLALSDGTRSRLTHALLRAATDLEPWTFGHSTVGRYPERSVEHPTVWLIRRRGLLQTTLGPTRFEMAVAPELSEYRDLLPVVTGVPTTAAHALGLPRVLAELSAEGWSLLLARAGASQSDGTASKAYTAAAGEGVIAPGILRCRVGLAVDEREPSSVAVTADDDLAHHFRKTGDPYLRVASSSDADLLAERWGLQLGERAVRSEVGFVQAGDAEPLVDLYPALRFPLDESLWSTPVVPCSDLRIETHTQRGRTTSPRSIVFEGPSIYRQVDVEDAVFLQQISERFALGLGEPQIAAIIQNLEDRQIQELRRSIRDASDHRRRLLLAIGRDELRGRMPQALLDAAEQIHGDLNDEHVADLALAAHGVEVLQRHKDVLETRGLTPPSQWAGRRKAVEFVRDLGFGSEYAGFEKESVDPNLEVEGRPDIPRLHEYQRLVVDELRDLVRGDNGLRGLLSLPTGAGKTRVTIEALVDAMVDGDLRSPILWVAQTQELCEQAVQTWSEIWRGLGPRRRLTISRLWSSFEAVPADYGEQVVVATIQKLDSGVYEKQSYDWLKGKAEAVVVDEAHSSVGPSYTALLEWQGMGRNVDRVPLIGLTATPFKGTNEEEGRRLVRRYAERRLDYPALGSADAYPRLQELGILSQVDHETLPGHEVSLTDAELKSLEEKRQLPARASQALAANIDRNRTLLEHITSLDSEWPVLLFGTSVEHAQIMAALLAREGVPSAAITGEMDRGARRHAISQFRNGAIRVLTNYNVLTAGFDAPRVRALYVARPTYSPNLYQQMIGRGLRGPRNGGTDRCLLVNVEDNVAQYGQRLAFHEFDHLWSGGDAEGSGHGLAA
jgi:superfamily II DNA or RNA helicase